VINRSYNFDTLVTIVLADEASWFSLGIRGTISCLLLNHKQRVLAISNKELLVISALSKSGYYHFFAQAKILTTSSKMLAISIHIGGRDVKNIQLKNIRKLKTSSSE